MTLTAAKVYNLMHMTKIILEELYSQSIKITIHRGYQTETIYEILFFDLINLSQSMIWLLKGCQKLCGIRGKSLTMTFVF